MSVRKNGKFAFTVKEYHDGVPWITFEPLNSDSEKLLGNRIIGFDLPKGMDIDKASQIAKFMRDNLDEFFITNL